VGCFPGRKIRASSGKKAPEIHWNPPEKFQQISHRNTASTPAISGAFLQDLKIFPASFPQDPVKSGSRNL